MSRKELEATWSAYYLSTIFFCATLEHLFVIRANPKDNVIVYCVVFIMLNLLIAATVLFFFK